MYAGLRRARLLERMRARKRVLLEASIDDASDGRIGHQIHLEQLGPDRVADQADVRDRHAIAMAVAAGLRIAAEMGLKRGERLAKPVADPFEARRLVKLELALEIVAHARYDQGMGVASDDHCER